MWTRVCKIEPFVWEHTHNRTAPNGRSLRTVSCHAEILSSRPAPFVVKLCCSREYGVAFIIWTKSDAEVANLALLPSVIIPIEDKEPFSYAPSVISHMEQQCIIKQATTDRDQALMEAKYYRNLAETFKTEKRDMEQAYANRVEVVRDFWRNIIVEGDSRGGKILRASLLKK